MLKYQCPQCGAYGHKWISGTWYCPTPSPLHLALLKYNATAGDIWPKNSEEVAQTTETNVERFSLPARNVELNKVYCLSLIKLSWMN